jgi:hypothetical protein
MKKIDKPLGWKPKGDQPEITTKEEPARRERKTKKVEPEVVAAEPVVEPAAEVAEVVAEPVSEPVEETPAEPTF